MNLIPNFTYFQSMIKEMLFQSDNRTATDWNVEDGYSASADPETYPERVLGPGARAGLYMVLNGFEQDFDNMCRGPVQGFKVRELLLIKKIFSSMFFQIQKVFK